MSSEVSFSLEYPCGLVGKIADLIEEKSLRPQRGFSVLASLMVMSCVSQNRFLVGGYDTPLNLFGQLIGRTGGGKEAPQTIVTDLLLKVSLRVGADVMMAKDWVPHFEVTEHFTSGASLHRKLAERRRIFYWRDEIWQLFESQKTNNHDQAFLALAMSCYGRANGVLGAYQYADRQLPAVEQPYLIMGGSSTLKRFVDSLQNEHVADGLLNRFLYSINDDLPPKRIPRDCGELESAIVSSLVALHEFTMLKGRVITLTGIMDKNVIGWQDDGSFLEMERFNEEADALNLADERFGNLWSRAHQQALTIAGILAIGMSLPGKITLAMAKWAIAYVKRSIKAIKEVLIAELGDANNVYKKISDKVLAVVGKLSQRDGVADHREVLRYARLKSKEFREVVETLLETGQLELVLTDGKGNKKRRAYRLT